ncbi:MAG TPA: glutaredoxin family protein [Candidatus Parcubacteria bacterium]|nr:glutaredoxin family protein [Candidatus Parcubacteria bacterium]
MVKIYTTPYCPYCYTLKEFLKEKGVEFREIDVSSNEKEKERIIKKTGKAQVPIVEINDQVIVGFDKEKICQLLKIRD